MGLKLLKDCSGNTFIECQSFNLQQPQFELKAVLKLALESGLDVDTTQLLIADTVSVKKIFSRVDQIIPFYELETSLAEAKIPFERKLSDKGIELKITCTIAELETSAKSRK